MDEVRICFEISGQALQDLEKLLGRDTLNKLGKEAFMEWVDWLQGKQRPMTVPDLEAHRIYTIYNEILSKKLPSASQLSSSLSLPPSRGQYIARSIRSQHPLWWRKRLLEMALEDCQNSKKLVLKLSSGKEKEIMVLHTDPDCKIIFEQLFQRLVDDLKMIDGSHQGKKKGNTIRYEIGCDTYDELIKAIQKDLESLEKTQIGE